MKSILKSLLITSVLTLPSVVGVDLSSSDENLSSVQKDYNPMLPQQVRSNLSFVQLPMELFFPLCLPLQKKTDLAFLKEMGVLNLEGLAKLASTSRSFNKVIP